MKKIIASAIFIGASAYIFAQQQPTSSLVSKERLNAKAQQPVAKMPNSSQEGSDVKGQLRSVPPAKQPRNQGNIKSKEHS